MENASKALIMAGEVLIAIIIMSALVLLFNSLTSYQNVEKQNERETEVIQFNNKYEAYNRDDVRGNDLYSLINRVADYNKRKSTEGEEGKELAYQPIELNVNLKTKDGTKDQKNFTYDGTQRIFKSGSEFCINSTNNTFKTLFSDIMEKETSYPPKALNNLANGITKIFIEDKLFEDEDNLNNDIRKAQQIIYNFNSAYGSAKFSANNESDIRDNWKEINRDYKEDVYTYYEYLQFTRAHFECTGVGYNQGTGRIVEMSFQFTGEIN